MSFYRLLVTVILSCFATAVMSYISMAVPVGPWIETTVVLLGMILFSLRKNKSAQTKIVDLGLATAASGIGGILATGMGFSFPTLYFVDKALFQSWLSSPFYFCIILFGLAFSAGSFGLAAAQIFEHQLLIKQELAFPIGELIQKVIIAQNQISKAISLIIGFVSTTCFLYAQKCSALIAHQFTLLSKISWSYFTLPQIAIKTELIPMFLAVGFVTGHLIALPLGLGFLAKILILDPLQNIYAHQIAQFDFASSWLAKIVPLGNAGSSEEFTIAFCSGMVIYGVLISFLGLPRILRTFIKRVILKEHMKSSVEHIFARINPGQILIASLSSILLFSYFGFSIASQLYILIFTFIWVYQVLIIAGKMGIAPLGRFATFVMVPGMLLFGFTALQTTLVATFVEIAAGVASDTLFGRRMAQLAQISHRNIIAYQWLGLLVSSLVVGVIFWFVISYFGIGAEADLSVVKAQSRALLINSKNFDFLVLLLGLIFGYILTYMRINPALVLGGILMPPQYSLLLILGGVFTYFVRDKEEYYPFWSGVFAANSIWMLIQTFFKTVVCH